MQEYLTQLTRSALNPGHHGQTPKETPAMQEYLTQLTRSARNPGHHGQTPKETPTMQTTTTPTTTSRPRHLAATVLLPMLLTVLGIGHRAQAVNYTWGSATSGNWSATTNWTPNGDPNVVGDTATINATGAPYTVTVNAARKIGALTLNSADATLNASSILTSTATPTLTAGAIQGTVYFSIDASPLNVNLTNVTFPAAATIRLQRETGGGKSSTLTLPATIPANLTLHLRQTDGPYDRGALTVTTPNGFTNDGTIQIDNTGAYGSTMTYTIQSGTLTNRNLITMSTVGSPGDGAGRHMGVITFDAPIINEAMGEIRLDRTNGSTTDDGRIVVGRSNISHINRGLIRVDGGDGISFVGTTLTNEGGTIRNNGITTTLRTRTGSATIDNALGTIEARGGSSASIFTIQNALSASTRSGSTLLAGNYTVTGGSASTTLTLTGIGGAGSITALGAPSGNPATVTLNGATAAFTQLESASGSLANIYATGTLNLLGGKAFVAASTLANAGTILVGSDSSLGLGSAGTGTLNSTGSLTVHGTLGAAGATINVSGGSLGGTGDVVGNVTVSGTGVLGGTVTITGDTVVQNLHSPGDSPAIQTIDGNYTLDGGTLLIELGGTTPGSEHDQVVVTGDAILDGILAVEFLPGYFPDPKKGSIYDVLTASSITTEPGFALGGTWGSSFLWEVIDGNTLRLTSNIPEPTSLALLGLAGLAALRRRR